MPTDALLGREHERGILLGALDDARAGRARTLLLHGAAGIGKTALLRAARQAATGFTVVGAAGVDTEAELTYAGLVDVVRPLLHLLDDLPAPQAAALRGACRLGPNVTDDPFAAAVATLALLAMAAAEAPLLVVVDDLQWVDGASAQALTFVARRLTAEPICMLFTVRDGESTPVDLTSLDQLTVEPLRDTAARALLRGQLAAPLPRRVSDRILRYAAGNPLALQELPAALSPDELAALSTTGPPLPVRARIEAIYAGRFAAMPVTTRAALVVAAAAETGLAERIESACRELGLPEQALTAALDTGLLRPFGPQLGFRHPLARSAIYQLATPARRRDAHRALAAVAAQHGDDELASWHRYAAADGPDESLAGALERTGRAARAAGGHVAASAALRRSAAMTDNPVDRVRRLVAAADSALVAGRAEDAVRLGEDAAAFATDVHARAEVALMQARLALHGGVPTPATVDQLEQLAADPSTTNENAVRMLTDGAALAIYLRQIPRATQLAEDAYARATGTGTVTAALAATTLGLARAYAGRRDADHLLTRFADLAVTQDTAVEGARQLQRVGVALGALHRHADGAAYAQRFIAAAREVGAVGFLPMALALYSHLSFFGGAWGGGSLAAAEALQLAEVTGQRPMALWAHTCQAMYAGARGEPFACRAAAEAAFELLGATGVETFRTMVLCALGMLGIAEAEPGAAVDAFDRAYAIVAPQGPLMLLQWKADYVEGLLAVGRRSDAAAVVDGLSGRAREPNARWDRAVLARSRALLDGGSSTAAWSPALLAARELPSPFPLARAELLWASRLAADGDRHAARERATSALRAFERLEATRWITRAAQLLDDIGVPQQLDPDPLSDLPPVARQVARMVADGHTVDTVAVRLFLGKQTARAHLDRVLTTLGVDDPTHLPAVLADAPAPHADGASYHVRLLGAFEVRRDGSSVELRGVPGQAVKIVATAGGELHADELIETLWPETDPDAGRTRLRNVLSRVRQAAGPLLVRRGQAVALVAGTTVDTIAFDTAAAHAAEADDDDDRLRWGRRAVSQYAGELLPLDRYADWANSARERLRRHFVAVLDELADATGRSGDLPGAIGWLERAVSAEPYEDDRYVRLARLQLAAGRRRAAGESLRAAGRIAAEFGIAPPPTLAELAATVRRPA